MPWMSWRRWRGLAVLALALAVVMMASGLAQAADSAKAAERLTATVVEFQVRGQLGEHTGAIIADLMMSAIANTNRFTLRDRLPLSAAAKIAKAQELGETGLLDPKTAAELGRLYQLDAVITGGVYKLGDLITVTARLIDTKTAALLSSGQIQGQDIDTIQIKINELAAMIAAPPPAPVPKTFALTVKTDPPDATVRLLNGPAYQLGMKLVPGVYDLEVVRDGYKPRKGQVQISERDAAVTINLEKIPPPQYRLTVNAEPADARIRLLGIKPSYTPGINLAPGSYSVEVSRSGYETQRVSVSISNSDVTMPVQLVKTPEPQRYRLTVQTDPPGARVRLLGIKAAYKPGVALTPGTYTVEVSQAGYETRQMPVSLTSNDITLPVVLIKRPEPTLYRLTVQTDPPGARVRLLGVKAAYKPGVALTPGNYTVEVSQAGYETRQVSASITQGDLTLPVALIKTPEPPRYRLTISPQPSDARVRLIGIKAAYKPGMALTPGTYRVEITRPGYDSQRVSVSISNSDVTMPVQLVKTSEPQRYRLTVQADPPGARVRLLGVRSSYAPGMALAPGTYTVEVSQSGYETRRIPVSLTSSDITLPVVLIKTPEPTLYRLTVRTEPPGARVRLRGTRTAYRPGVLLPPGNYTVEVSQPGYEPQQVTARLLDGDATLSAALVKEPEPQRYRLTVQADPPDARIRLVNSASFYRPGMLLSPGSYTIEVAARGYESTRTSVRITHQDVSLPITLEPVAVAAPPPRRQEPASRPSSAPAPTASTRAGEWRIGSVQADGSLSGVDRSEFNRIFSGYAGRTVTRDSLLEGAVQFYRATGITLSFTVRNSTSASAELSGRAVNRARRSHESSVSIVSRSQLINSGFSVSAQ